MIPSLARARESKASGGLHGAAEKAAAQRPDTVHQIVKGDLSVFSEISLGSHDERLSELGKRKAGGFFDRLIKVHVCKSGIHSDNVLAAKFRRWIGEQNNPIKAAWPAEEWRGQAPWAHSRSRS
jgi:hypothetical protein